MGFNDRELGMQRRIARRDFMNGVAWAAGAMFAPDAFAQAVNPEIGAGYYPPTKTGMRGDHDEIFKTPHAVRDNTFWQTAGTLVDTGEEYDLVIVGGGISGLASAYFYRQAMGPSARILIVENHDDFGGHAKRNEFHHAGVMRLGYGGTYAIESPSPYSKVARGLIQELGIEVASFSRVLDRKLYAGLGMTRGVFFDEAVFGRDALLPAPPLEADAQTAGKAPTKEQWKTFIDKAPLAEAARQDLYRLCHEPKDYLPGLTSDEKKYRLARMSYAAFLTGPAGCHPDVVKYLQPLPQSWFGLGIDAVPAQDAWGLGYPGFDGLKLDAKPGPGQNRDSVRSEEAERYFFHFPDGNSSIARLLVRRLIPEAVPGRDAIDIVEAHTDYAQLDRKEAPVRIRLSSTVVRVQHLGRQAVEIAYMRQGALQSVRAKHCVLACWHVMIPYICTELPAVQKTALSYAVKVPLVYTNVLLNKWTAFQKLGVSGVYAPGSYHTEMNLDMPVSLGQYRFPHSPEEPIVVHMQRVPTHPGLPSRDQHRAGRADLYTTTFESFERKIRDQFARTLAGGGFDPAEDIAAITVNRWPHGYAYEYNSLWDRFWLEGGEQPCVVARQPFGRIAIANSDAGAYAYTDSAIDQAHRAVQDLLQRA